jgi:hypothetical protein
MCESVVERECDVTGNKITNCYREWFWKLRKQKIVFRKSFYIIFNIIVFTSHKLSVWAHTHTLEQISGAVKWDSFADSEKEVKYCQH